MVKAMMNCGEAGHPQGREAYGLGKEKKYWAGSLKIPVTR